MDITETENEFMYCSQFRFGKFGTNAQRGKRISFKYDGVDEILIHTPVVHVPYSLRDKTAKADGRVFMKTIPLSLTKIELPEQSKSNNKHIKAFKSFVENVDLYVKEDVLSEYSESVYSSMYKDTFNVSIRLDYNTKEPMVEVYQGSQIVEFNDHIFKNKLVSCIIKLDSIWISNGKAGVNWYLDSIQIIGDYNPPSKCDSNNMMLIQNDNEIDNNDNNNKNKKVNYYLQVEDVKKRKIGYFVSNDYSTENKLIDTICVLLNDYPNIEYKFNKTRIPEHDIVQSENKKMYTYSLDLKKLLSQIVTGVDPSEFTLNSIM